MTGFNLQFIHRQTTSNFFWGAAADYSAVSTGNMKFGYWLFSPTVGYSIFKNPLFSVDIYASLDLGVNLNTTLKPITKKSRPDGSGEYKETRVLCFSRQLSTTLLPEWVFANTASSTLPLLKTSMATPFWSRTQA